MFRRRFRNLHAANTPPNTQATQRPRRSRIRRARVRCGRASRQAHLPRRRACRRPPRDHARRATWRNVPDCGIRYGGTAALAPRVASVISAMEVFFARPLAVRPSSRRAPVKRLAFPAKGHASSIGRASAPATASSPAAGASHGARAASPTTRPGPDHHDRIAVRS
jgi:hypothetical protein